MWKKYMKWSARSKANSNKIILYLVLPLILSGVSLAKLHQDQAKPASNIADVLSDFTFVGAGKHSPTSVAEHDTEAKVLPSKLEANRQYIFHRTTPTDNYELFETLQQRLRQQGIRIIRAVEEGDRYVGGLSFFIQFQDGRHTGFIANRLDTELMKSMETSLGTPDDYLLVIEKNAN